MRPSLHLPRSPVSSRHSKCPHPPTLILHPPPLTASSRYILPGKLVKGALRSLDNLSVTLSKVVPCSPSVMYSVFTEASETSNLASSLLSKQTASRGHHTLSNVSNGCKSNQDHGDQQTWFPCSLFIYLCAQRTLLIMKKRTSKEDICQLHC